MAATSNNKTSTTSPTDTNLQSPTLPSDNPSPVGPGLLATQVPALQAAVSTSTPAYTPTTTTTSTSAFTSAPSPSPSSTIAHRPHHSSSPSTISLRAAGFLGFFDRTLSGKSEPRVRSRQSLSRLSTGPEALATFAAVSGIQPGQSSPERPPRSIRSASQSTRNPPSQPYSETDPSRPEPTLVGRLDNKMHQTSSRLLRMTDDDRPFTKVSLSCLQSHCAEVGSVLTSKCRTSRICLRH